MLSVRVFLRESRRLFFFGHLARMDENADDASQAIFQPSIEKWRRPLGQPCTTWMKNIHGDLSSLYLGIYEARNLAQNRPLETDVFAQRYALLVAHATIVYTKR